MNYNPVSVIFRGDEVLNCGVNICPEYGLTNPEFVNLEHHPADFDSLNFITGGVILDGYVYAVTNWGVIARVPTATFDDPEYLDISTPALMSPNDWIYAHAPFVY